MPRRGIERIACPPHLALAVALLVAFPTRPASAEPRAAAVVSPAAPPVKPKRVPGSRLVLEAADKQRVPKPPRDEPRYKADSSGTSTGSTSEDDDWASQCIGDCAGNLLSSICSGLMSSVGSNAAGAGPQGGAWAVGDHARLTSNLSADSVSLREAPGEGGAQAPAPGRLQHGQRVVVVETAVLADGVWIRVRPEDRLEPVGWVRDGSAIRFDRGPPPGRARHRGSGSWAARIVAGGGGQGPSELNVEYLNGGFRVSAEVVTLLAGSWQLAGGVGYRLANGLPQVIYLTPTTVEEPLKSRLRIFDLGARGGQRFTWGSGLRFDWQLGPTLCYVHEWCDLRVTDAATSALIVQRDETLGRWAGGGELRLGFARALPRGPEITLVTGAYVLAWRGQRVRSLSSDFVQSAIHGFDIALGLTFAGR